MIHIVTKEEIQKGWSGEKKYRITDENGTPYLLRVANSSQKTKKEAEFRLMQRVAALGIPMCEPLEFGEDEEGVWSIQRWIDGKDMEEVITALPDARQYAYGLEAGVYLKQIHSFPAPANQEPWEPRFNRKMDYKIQKYTECPLKYEGGEAFLTYIAENRHLLAGRPQTFQHGDYHIGNMMLDRNRNLQIIDFNRFDFGDPWEEFNRIVWCAQKSPLFATGMVDGYFDGDVPMEFWRLLALYIASNTLSSLYWAIPFGEGEIATMRRQAAEVLSWYDGMKNPVPTWYRCDFHLQYLDGIPFKLNSPFDFSFLSEYGRVFKIFDDQDSGNICFGCEKAGRKVFVKFAGAPTAEYDGDPADAVERLLKTLPIYRDLRHKNLIALLDSREVAGGYAMIFEWAEGISMGRMYPSEHQAFMALPTADRLQVFSDILDFFLYVGHQNYLAVDFYDGSIMYNPKTRKTTICDIDFFRRLPTQNDMGRMWGSSKFQAPEEYVLGAALDTATNVYNLGSMAFALFGSYQRTRENWELSDRLFAVATKATAIDRRDRYPDAKALKEAWEAALHE